MYELSPAVERAEAAVRQAASGQATLAHWLLVLLDDDMGKPAALLERAGVSLETAQSAVSSQPDSPVAPDSGVLYRTARDLGIRFRADPALTTDLVFLAVLLADAAFAQRLSHSGLALETLLPLIHDIQPEQGPKQAGSEFQVSEVPESLTAARAVDANLNRARESLRVLDDFARFVLDDRGLTERVKGLRHQLAEASARLPAGLLLAARDTANDVGTAVFTDREYARTTPAEVAAVNLKRLQEALRSAEEFGKVLDAGFGKAVEAIRYEAYTLEREVVRGAEARAKLADARLYMLLTGSQCVRSMDWVIEQAALGGVDVFQLREKELPDRELIARARQVREWTRRAGVLFVVNDRPDIARLVEADGVHLGQDDLPVAAARRIVGPEMLIGVSTHNLEQVRQAIRDGADYLGVGPTFPSRTKQFEAFAGLNFVREVAAETTLPWFALGGINAGNVAEVVAAGAGRIAVSAAIATADEPRAAAVVLKGALLAPRAG